MTKHILHLTISEPLPDWAQPVIAAQQADTAARVEIVRLGTENAAEVLEKIFTANSVCVWPAATP